MTESQSEIRSLLQKGSGGHIYRTMETIKTALFHINHDSKGRPGSGTPSRWRMEDSEARYNNSPIEIGISVALQQLRFDNVL